MRCRSKKVKVFKKKWLEWEVWEALLHGGSQRTPAQHTCTHQPLTVPGTSLTLYLLLLTCLSHLPDCQHPDLELGTCIALQTLFKASFSGWLIFKLLPIENTLKVHGLQVNHKKLSGSWWFFCLFACLFI